MHSMLLVARREWKLLHRSRSAQAAAILVLAIAWLPPLLVSMRAARLGLAPFADVTPLTLAIAGVILPLLALLAGADLLAGELEDGSLVPVVSLPISRRACYLGKFLGRACVMGAFYVLGFGSAGAAIGILHGPDGWQDYVVVAAGGFLLSLSCAGIGAALASTSRSRVRAYGASLGLWVLLVFALDAGLLAATIGFAPPPPDNVGHHGHDELVAPGGSMDAMSDHIEGSRARTSVVTWLMMLNPVDLFRLSALTIAPDLSARWMLFAERATPPWLIILVGWILWTTVPAALGMYLFERLPLA